MMAQGAEASARGSQPAMLTCIDGTRPRVLLAEDSDTARVLTAALLRRMGCDVDAVEHGEEALNLAQNFAYDLILLDIEMPVMDGVIAAREIRALGGAAGETPLMALSAFLADTSKCGRWQETFDVALSKPAGRDQLRNAIQAALNSRALNRDAQGANARAFARSDLLIDKAALNEIKGKLSAAAWHAVVDAAIAEMHEMTRTIVFAQGSGESADLAAQARRLKICARNFAAPRLAGLAERLEEKSATSGSAQLVDLLGDLRKTAERTIVVLSALNAD